MYKAIHSGVSTSLAPLHINQSCSYFSHLLSNRQQLCKLLVDMCFVVVVFQRHLITIRRFVAGSALTIQYQCHGGITRDVCVLRRHSSAIVARLVGSGGRAVERRTVNRGDGGSIPPAAVSKRRQFRSPHIACVFRKKDKKTIWCLCQGK